LSRLFQATASALVLLCALVVSSASAQNTYGTLSNFDVFNHTGSECHGFEIELDGVHKEDITWIFGAPWNRYGDPAKEDKLDAQGNVIGAYLRYRSPVDPATNQFTQTTQIPPSLLPGGSGTIAATDGHACYAGGPIGNYDTSGCEHFGLGFMNGNPTNTVYHWLIEDPANPGQLMTSDTKVSIPAVTWNVQPPVDPALNPNPVVQAVIPAEPQEVWACAQYGEAQWVKVYKTEAPQHVQLEHLLTDDPAVPREASETEIEWQIMQALPTCDENGAPLPPDLQPENDLTLAGAVGDGNESVTRRYEFYKYTGALDAETHEALPINDTNLYLDANNDPILDDNGNPIANGDLDDYIGAQMAAINLIPPLAVTNAALPVGEVGITYTQQTLVSGGVPPYTITLADGALPAGLSLDLTTGVLSHQQPLEA
jgi:hypothetical protein